MATIVGTDGQNLLWVDELGKLRSTPDNTSGLQGQIKDLQTQVDALSSGYPPITNLDTGVF